MPDRHRDEDPAGRSTPRQQSSRPSRHSRRPSRRPSRPSRRLAGGLLLLIRHLWILPIRFYQLVISPWLPAACIYHPTCSDYTRQAIMRHGALRGTALGVLRIGRCIGALYDGGEDPVPDSIRWTDIFREYRQRLRFRSR